MIKRKSVWIEERVHTKLTDMSKLLEDHNTGLTLLHEGQMYLELNLKILMKKIGVTPSNTLPSYPHIQSSIIEVANAIAATEEALVEGDLDSDFKMTEDAFDKVLEDCSRYRGPPPQKY